MDNDFRIIKDEYPHVEKLHIFGVMQKPLRVFYQSRKNSDTIKDFKPENIIYVKEKKVLYISSLGISLNDQDSYKIVIQFE